MKSRLIVFAVCLLVVMPSVTVAQTPWATQASAADEPPALPQRALVNASQPDEVITRLLAFQPDIPLGPVDVLKGYEDGMTVISQRLSNELISIAQANRANQITRDEAEYFIQERYQVAMMQHEVLNALHDSLQNDLAREATHPDRVTPSDSIPDRVTPSDSIPNRVTPSDSTALVQPPLAQNHPNQALLKH